MDQDFGRIWLTNHSANGQMLNKPVVLEEFGKVGMGVTTKIIGAMMPPDAVSATRKGGLCQNIAFRGLPNTKAGSDWDL